MLVTISRIFFKIRIKIRQFFDIKKNYFIITMIKLQISWRFDVYFIEFKGITNLLFYFKK